MLSWVGVAVTVLGSPADVRITQGVSEHVLSPALVVATEPARTPEVRLRGWLSSLAVVRPPDDASRAPSSMVLFVAVAPVGGAVGVRAIGTF